MQYVITNNGDIIIGKRNGKDGLATPNIKSFPVADAAFSKLPQSLFKKKRGKQICKKL